MSRVGLIALIGALIGLASWALGLWVDPGRAWHAYLSAFNLAASIAAGALVLLMVGYVTGARWMAVIRRLNEAVLAPLPALAILFIPVVIGAEILYPWHGGAEHYPRHVRHLLEHRAPYLNLTGFAARGALYFAIWLIASELLRGWSARRDRGESAGGLSRERILSAVMLPPVALAITFAAIDWVMSIEPAWFSTIFGVYYFAGGFVAALALLSVLAVAARGPLDGAITEHHLGALGRLVFAFGIFWAYAAFFQALLIALANKPPEIGFYLVRTEGAWSAVVYLLVLGHFALPFFALMRRSAKRDPRVLAAVSIWILAMHAVDLQWLVMPRAPGAALFSWIDLAALVGVGCVVVAVAAWRQSRRPLIARNDPLLEAGLRYRSSL